MAAGLGFKTFAVGEVLSAANVNGYLMQGVLVFANATARDAAITSPQEGQFAFTKDNDSLWYYSGSAWVASGATGDIEGVTAGTGISGGGTSGTVTITNSMATAIDAKGDLVVGTGADTFSRLAVGTNGHTLVADSAQSTGLKWAAPSSGAMVFIKSQDFSASSSVDVDDAFSSTYDHYFIILNNTGSTSTDLAMRFRASGSTNTQTKYNTQQLESSGTTTSSSTTNLTNSGIRIGRNTTGRSSSTIWLQNPYASLTTCAQALITQPQTSANALGFQAGSYTETDSFTGLNLNPSSGTITGTITIYGLAKS
jgi:hypothetical protein